MLYVWGCGEFGQHGHGHQENVSLENGKLELQEKEKVEFVSCGASHTIFSTDNNKLYGCGNNGTSQLGSSYKQQAYLKPVPIPATYLQQDEVAGVSCGSRQSFVWTKSGKCYYYGRVGGLKKEEKVDDSEQMPSFLGNLTVKEIACGAAHAVFCLQDGGVLSIGSNSRGQLGNGSKTESRIPVKIHGIESLVTHVACGNAHSLCLTDNNTVYNWGYGPACGHKVDVTSAEEVEFEDYEEVTKLQGGDSHSVALTTAGRVFLWGNNHEGQLGTSTSKELVRNPICMTGLIKKGKCIDISARDDTTAAVLKTGEIYMWGKNMWDVLRGGSTKSSGIASLFQVDMDGVKANRVSLGSWHVGVVARNNIEETMDNTEEPISDTDYSANEYLSKRVEKKIGGNRTKVGLSNDAEFELQNQIESILSIESNRGFSNMAEDRIESNENSKYSAKTEIGIKRDEIKKNIGKSNYYERNKVIGRMTSQQQQRSQKSSKFSTGSLLSKKIDFDTARKGLNDNNNNICCFVSIADETETARTKNRTRSRTRTPTSRETRNRHQVLDKTVSSAGPFITQLQPESQAKSSKEYLGRTKMPSVWNTETLLNKTSTFSTYEKAELIRPPTATRSCYCMTTSFQRSKSFDVNIQGKTMEGKLPKLQQKLERTEIQLIDDKEIRTKRKTELNAVRKSSATARRIYWKGK